MPGAALAVVLVLTSGGLLVAAGAWTEADQSGAATAAGLAAGVVAQVGFLFARHSESQRQADGRRPIRWSLLAASIAVSFVAGAIMFAAGYVGARGYWWAWPFIAALAAPAIGIAYLLDRRARRV